MVGHHFMAAVLSNPTPNNADPVDWYVTTQNANSYSFRVPAVLLHNAVPTETRCASPGLTASLVHWDTSGSGSGVAGVGGDSGRSGTGLRQCELDTGINRRRIIIRDI